MPVAIAREVSPQLGECELAYLPRREIDVGRARVQHAAYLRALSALGCRVVTLPAEAGLPDAVFVEDTAIVLDEIAVIAHPGALSRRPETESVARALEPWRPLVRIAPPATLEGGDVMRVGRTLYVGLSGRTNGGGVEQLRALVAGYGYEVRPVAVRGCLHLKSAVTQVSPDALLINPAWTDVAPFRGLELVAVDPAEPHGANALMAGPGVIYSAAFPRTLALLAARGIAVTVVDVSELQKAEGAVTCCSLVFAGS